jgi:hypothetical protein
MKQDISWLIGRQLIEIRKMDYSWSFRLDDGSVISTESTWRIITVSGIVITSEDHEQQFGLPAPLDAAKVATREIVGHSITKCRLDSATGDLHLDLGSRRLQFLCLSSGYESWQITHGEQNLICTGGGKIVEFKPEQK